MKERARHFILADDTSRLDGVNGFLHRWCTVRSRGNAGSRLEVRVRLEVEIVETREQLAVDSLEKPSGVTFSVA